MTNERLVLCGGAKSADPPFGGPPLRLRANGRHPDVDLQIGAIAEALTAPVPLTLVDLIDIAAYVYCADQAVTRGGPGVENVGSEWRRRLHFVIPVRMLDLWRSAEVMAALTSTLGFLSDDEYSFEFVALKDGPAFQDYLFTEDGGVAVEAEEVALFSGGLDSLSGAIQEAVVGQRKVAFVTHQPSSKLVPRYDQLRSDLTKRSAHAPLFVPVRINKLKSLGREYTQRSRSFLYVALGASVASALGLSRVRFYENGVISFNFPPSGQVVGAKATRTTHPRVLHGFAEILRLATGSNFVVENPYLWRTKADVIRSIVVADCHEMIKYSTSCTHTWEMTNLHPHCGSCSQCIDRRFAVLAAEAERWDPEDGYKTKLLTDARPADETRTMLASYVENASQVSRMSDRAFFAKFGEASRVLRYIPGSPDDAARRVYDLHRRHATGISGVVDRAIAAHSTGIRERSLPATCLLRLVCDASSTAATSAPPVGPSVPTPTPVRARNSFLKKGKSAWEVWFDGGSDFLLVRSKAGAAYLHLLLTSQGNPVSAAKLASTVAMLPQEFQLGNASEASDGEAMDAYRVRSTELLEEIEEARANHDESRVEVLQHQIAQLSDHIKALRGLGGSIRKAVDERDKVRKRVGIAIRRVLKEIGEWDRSLAEHFKPPTLKLGLNPCYAPSPSVVWQLM